MLLFIIFGIILCFGYYLRKSNNKINIKVSSDILMLIAIIGLIGCLIAFISAIIHTDKENKKNIETYQSILEDIELLNDNPATMRTDVVRVKNRIIQWNDAYMEKEKLSKNLFVNIMNPIKVYEETDIIAYKIMNNKIYITNTSK